MVQRQELELAVGDILRIGDTTVTVIDIENDEITFRIDDADLHDEDPSNDLNDSVPVSLPR